MLLVVADLMHHLQQPEEESRIKAALPEVDLACATFASKFVLLSHFMRHDLIINWLSVLSLKTRKRKGWRTLLHFETDNLFDIDLVFWLLFVFPSCQNKKSMTAETCGWRGL